MGALRSISRSAHPEAWEIRRRGRKLRKLHQQASRAAASGDVKRMARLSKLLQRHEPALYEKILGEAKVDPLGGLIQRGKGGISPKGSEKKTGQDGKVTVYSKGNVVETDKEQA